MAHAPSLELSYALRISHDLDIYHKLDCEIIHDTEAIQRHQHGTLGVGNIVILDGPQKTLFGQWLLLQNMTDIRHDNHSLNLDGRILTGASTGVALLHPHPTSSSSSVLFLSAEDESGMESILRIFPIRTGVTFPDWVVVGQDAQVSGTAGVTNAGYVYSIQTELSLALTENACRVWGNNWKMNTATSWSY